ncbi:MAG: YjbQ family protein [Clostridia bacterium]|nr:YjbQ family protein [Clostridia bacterium]
MGFIKEYTVQTKTEGAYNITKKISEAIAESGVDDGIALVFCPHTTASITITENTDEHVTQDMLLGLKKSLPDREEYTHAEGNSFAHIKSSVLGCSLVLPVAGGWPMLGPWQNIFFLEFDGPRERRFQVKVIEC